MTIKEALIQVQEHQKIWGKTYRVLTAMSKKEQSFFPKYGKREFKPGYDIIMPDFDKPWLPE